MKKTFIKTCIKIVENKGCKDIDCDSCPLDKFDDGCSTCKDKVRLAKKYLEQTKNIDLELEILKLYFQRKQGKEHDGYEAIKEIYRKLKKEWTI